MRAISNLRASAIAIVTILAILGIPACGSLCASMNHCSSSAMSTEPDTCHHANMSAASDTEVLSSPASCDQQAPLLAILVASDASIQLDSVSAANGPFSTEIPNHEPKLDDRLQEFSWSDQSPQQSILLQSLSVLRI